VEQGHEEFGSVGCERHSGFGRLEDELEDVHRLLPHPVAIVEDESEEHGDDDEGVLSEEVLPEASDGLAKEVVLGSESTFGERDHEPFDARFVLQLGDSTDVRSESDDGFAESSFVHGMEEVWERGGEDVEGSFV